MITTALIVLVVLLSILLGVVLFRGRNAQPVIATNVAIQANQASHPQRRDRGAARLNRWVAIWAIWIGIIPGLIVTFILTVVSKFSTEITLTWVIVSLIVALAISSGLFLSVIQHFILEVAGNYVKGTKKQVGYQPLDDEGFPILGLFFSGLHPKFFWETVAFQMDLSRDVLVSEKDIPNHGDGPLVLETLTGVDLSTRFTKVLRPNLCFLQNLFHAGGEDAEEVIDTRSGRTRRDQFLAELFAADSAQRLSDIFASRDPEEIRANKGAVCRLWADQYADISNDMEERHGVHAGSFVISDTNFDTETGNRRKQRAGAIYDAEAANVHLAPFGITTTSALWNTPILNGNGQPTGRTWRGPEPAELKAAMDLVQVGSGEVTKTIHEWRAPSLEGTSGDNTSQGVLAVLAALLATRNGGN